jgi:hypothetical protein
MKKRVLGLTLFSMGIGMLLVLLIPGWGWMFTACIGFIFLGSFLVKHC